MRHLGSVLPMRYRSRHALSPSGSRNADEPAPPATSHCHSGATLASRTACIAVNRNAHARTGDVVHLGRHRDGLLRRQGDKFSGRAESRFHCPFQIHTRSPMRYFEMPSPTAS